MGNSQKTPNLIGLLSLAMFSAAVVTGDLMPLGVAGLFGLAAALGLQAARCAREAELMATLRRIAEGLRKRSHGRR